MSSRGRSCVSHSCQRRDVLRQIGRPQAPSPDSTIWCGESTGYSGFSQSGVSAQHHTGCPCQRRDVFNQIGPKERCGKRASGKPVKGATWTISLRLLLVITASPHHIHCTAMAQSRLILTHKAPTSDDTSIPCPPWFCCQSMRLRKQAGHKTSEKLVELICWTSWQTERVQRYLRLNCGRIAERCIKANRHQTTAL